VQFIEAVEKVSKESRSALEFNDGLNRETQLLEDHMKCLDRDVLLRII
jgi:hypothetical protein